MVVGEIAEHVDVLVVGAGPGGYVAAARAAELGREVMVVDRGGREGGLGGACLHVGCIPSKALIELAATLDHVRGLRSRGLVCEEPEIDLAAFQAHRREIVDGLAAGVAGLLRRHGARHVHGSLRFNRPDRAAVLLPSGMSLFVEFDHVIVATGSRPVALPGLPFDGERVLDSTGALALDRLPETLAVVGGGYIGLELGMAFARLGTRVTMVEALDRVLPSVPERLTRPVLRELDALGVDLRLHTRAAGLDGDDLVLHGPQGPARVRAEHVVVAVGRRPNTDDLGLERAGIPVDAGGLIPVDAQRRASPTAFAVGDVTTGPALAHKASAEGRVAAEALCGLPAAFEPAAIPQVVFTRPEIATAGLTEEEAHAAGMDAEARSVPLASSGRAATLGARDGFTQVVVDRATDRIVGVHLVGPHASELVAEGVLAVELLASPEDLRATIHPHPTLSELLHDAVGVAAPPGPRVAVGSVRSRAHALSDPRV
jgi:dihydrolipoamide dehydrogenase